MGTSRYISGVRQRYVAAILKEVISPATNDNAQARGQTGQAGPHQTPSQDRLNPPTRGPPRMPPKRAKSAPENRAGQDRVPVVVCKHAPGTDLRKLRFRGANEAGRLTRSVQQLV
ncbi:hypothetical protein ACJ73_05564 [Blastomyces percursus]|uniref:Uncharacterized protein n=1 Tax=Blastomyces percursus TaxID=1658174 RepID=A0A1J9R500_9EURO|nr:hypothetical protein ACJ73_05564 [Blastomyces percursus]